MLISFIIPVYNPGPDIRKIIDCIREFGREYTKEIEIIIIDSKSTDGSTLFMKKDPYIRYVEIDKDQFNHGGTRNDAFLLSRGDYVVYMTQDAIPKSIMSFERLLQKIIFDPSIGMAFGRQLPKHDADFFGSFARLFNYPGKSMIKSWDDRNQLGIKTIFVSNSFAVYRRSALKKVGGFPENVILSEDTCVAARMIKEGWSISYEADACVYHSHNYTLGQEFKRYFDTGVFYGRENWIFSDFSKAEGEGKRFVLTQLRLIFKSRKINLLPAFFMRNFLKYLGYRLGVLERHLPYTLKKRISMNQQFWINELKGKKAKESDTEAKEKIRKLS